MNKNLIAYNFEEVEKKTVLSEGRKLYKSGMLSEAQWQNIREVFATNLYTPSLFIKVLLFLLSLVVILMGNLVGPFGLFGFLSDNEISLSLGLLFFGGLILFLTEFLVIGRNHHFKSGVTEAGIYTALGYIGSSVLIHVYNSTTAVLLVGLLLTLFAAIRYLDLTALVISLLLFTCLIGWLVISTGSVLMFYLPFILAAVFVIVYVFTVGFQKRLNSAVFDDQFVILKAGSLLLLYGSLNYWVVRMASVELMHLDLSDGGDIPFSFVFYLLTALIPIVYLYKGIAGRSILWIRVGLITVACSAATFKYFFSFGDPMLLITIAGAALIITAILLFTYLKQIRKGYTRDLLLHDKWNTQDLTAFVASQTLGGNRASAAAAEKDVFGGGSFGGGGAGGGW
ncbi:MAG TPA: hypothetical protein VFW78_08575 [Bacteroidia bacterium]|nr:hypothetical protein [Bacteroidia bacterium]